MECSQLDTYLRFRGIQESNKEVREEMIDISEFLELPQNELKKEVDEIYKFRICLHKVFAKGCDS